MKGSRDQQQHLGETVKKKPYHKQTDNKLYRVY